MTDSQRESIGLLWGLGKSPALISTQTGLSLAAVCGAIAEFSGQMATSPMRQRHLFDDQPDRGGVSER